MFNLIIFMNRLTSSGTDSCLIRHCKRASADSIVDTRVHCMKTCRHHDSSINLNLDIYVVSLSVTRADMRATHDQLGKRLYSWHLENQ